MDETERNSLLKPLDVIFAKKVLAGERLRGAQLTRLVNASNLSSVQVQELANEFEKRAPSGLMSEEIFKKELNFKPADLFGTRLFHAFCESTPSAISMEEFIIGVSRFAPRAPFEAKVNICYALFDVDRGGAVSYAEFEEVAMYSLKEGNVDVSEEQLKTLIQAEWAAMDVDGDGSLTQGEFQEHMTKNKEFVNNLTIHVPWIQAAYRKSQAKLAKIYLDTEPTKAVMSDLAVKVGASPDDANKWSNVLQENYYKDVASLKEITKKDWASMLLPRRLYSDMVQMVLNKGGEDDDIISSVSRKTRKLQNNLMYGLKQKKLQIIWGTIYAIGCIALFVYTILKFATPLVDIRYYNARLLLSPSIVVSRSFGAILKLNLSLMLFPVCYRTLTWLRATKFDHYIPIDSLMFWHRFVGASLLFCGLAHFGGHIVNFYNFTQKTPEEINAVFGPDFVSATPTYAQLLATRSGVTGLIMIICMLLMIPLASEKIRRSHFNVFFSTHHLYILIYICAALHDGFLYDVQIVYWLIPSVFVFLVERILTLIRSYKTYEVIEAIRHKGSIELRIKKPRWYTYSAGHYTWINCPDVSVWEWHPFTLTSSPDQDYISVHCNVVGGWTRGVDAICTVKDSKKEKNPKIYVTVGEGEEIQTEGGKKEGGDIQMSHMEEGKTIQLPRLRIDGPYGTASGDVFMYSHVILVGGGIGVTPFVSILKRISYKVNRSKRCTLQGVHFIWVAKSQDQFNWFVPILADMMAQEGLQGFLKVSVYLTGNQFAINDVRLLGMSMLIKRAKTTMGKDLVTGLESATTFGRPDFQKILLTTNNEWAGNTVGVFFCGPAPLAQSISVTCDALNKANRRQRRQKVQAGCSFRFKQEFF